MERDQPCSIFTKRAIFAFYLNVRLAFCNSNILNICIVAGERGKTVRKNHEIWGTVPGSCNFRRAATWRNRSCETEASRLQCNFGFMNKYLPNGATVYVRGWGEKNTHPHIQNNEEKYIRPVERRAQIPTNRRKNSSAPRRINFS